jgi:hypothetical protein
MICLFVLLDKSTTVSTCLECVKKMPHPSGALLGDACSGSRRLDRTFFRQFDSCFCVTIQVNCTQKTFKKLVDLSKALFDTIFLLIHESYIWLIRDANSLRCLLYHFPQYYGISSIKKANTIPCYLAKLSY